MAIAKQPDWPNDLDESGLIRSLNWFNSNRTTRFAKKEFVNYIKSNKLCDDKYLKQDFDFGNQKIQKYYTMEIDKLKEVLHLEVNALKKEFEGKQKVLLQKFDKDSKIKHSNSDLLNRSDKKRKKEKRPVQKPK